MITVISGQHCSRCRLVKQALDKKQMAYAMLVLENLTESEQAEYIAQAQAMGVFNLPIVLQDGVVSKELSSGII
jgi:glutaredoxin